MKIKYTAESEAINTIIKNKYKENLSKRFKSSLFSKFFCIFNNKQKKVVKLVNINTFFILFRIINN